MVMSNPVEKKKSILSCLIADYSASKIERFISFVCVGLALMVVCTAQSNITIHNHVPEQTIDGATHPEQIPDVIAYRLVLLGLSGPANPTDAQTKRHMAQFHAIGMTAGDSAILMAALSRFRAGYRSMIETYNETARAANASGQRADINSFLLERDQFVQSAHDQLKSALSSDGWTRLDAYVQNNKKHMKISVAEASR